jgi:hypothetical protein
MDIASLYLAWNRLRASLKRKYLDEYVSVVETTASGALHLHVLATGRYVPQRTLSRLAAKAGFGRIADVRAVRQGRTLADDDPRAADYVAKQLAGYVTKERTDGLNAKTAARRRPMRRSRGWGMSLAEAESLVVEMWRDGTSSAPADKDDGPWVIVHELADGSLLLRG